MQVEFLSIAQAKRWNVSRERVMAMVSHGVIPGAVVIPSAGRFGRAVKIPLSEVTELEEKWQVGSKIIKTDSRQRGPQPVAPRLEHFPELLAE